jgi:Pyruvate/2-oxoacid:ferredoxin oxidoreductase delta subunit
VVDEDAGPQCENCIIFCPEIAIVTEKRKEEKPLRRKDVSANRDRHYDQSGVLRS